MTWPLRLCFCSLALLSGCTTPYVIDDGGNDGAPPVDAPTSDVPSDGASPDAGVADAPLDACAARCVGGALDVCGMSTACPLGCRESPTAHCAEMVISNVDAAIRELPAGTIDVDTADTVTIDTDTCTWTGTTTTVPPGMVVSQAAGGPEVCLLLVRSLMVRGAGRLQAHGSRPLVIVAETVIDINGEISVDSTRTATGYSAGAGAGTGGTPGGGSVRVGSADSGAGGAGFGGMGGRGGDVGTVVGGVGGSAVASTLVPLIGGAAGGTATGGMGMSAGGPGGGAIQLSARVSIRVSGYVGASGAGGASTAMSGGAGPGGGSGGAILLEAPTVDIDAGRLNVSGGGGASGACTSPSVPGQDGARRSDRPRGGLSPCADTGSGGDGAGLDTVSGDAGGSSMTDNAAGGGGGAGRARLRALVPPDLARADLNPRFSPTIHVADTIETR